MDQEEQLDKLVRRINDTDLDKELLKQLLEDAENAIKDYCNRDTIPHKASALCRELAVIYYNRIGQEGVASKSEGAISVSYETDIPESIRLRLNAYRLLRMVGVANENK